MYNLIFLMFVWSVGFFTLFIISSLAWHFSYCTTPPEGNSILCRLWIPPMGVLNALCILPEEERRGRAATMLKDKEERVVKEMQRVEMCEDGEGSSAEGWSKVMSLSKEEGEGRMRRMKDTHVYPLLCKDLSSSTGPRLKTKGETCKAEWGILQSPWPCRRETLDSRRLTERKEEIWSGWKLEGPAALLSRNRLNTGSNFTPRTQENSSLK